MTASSQPNHVIAPNTSVWIWRQPQSSNFIYRFGVIFHDVPGCAFGVSLWLSGMGIWGPYVTVSLIKSWNYRNRLIFVAEDWYASSKDRHFVCEKIQWLFGNLVSAKATIWTDLLAMHLFNITTYLNHLTKPQATNSRQLAMRNRDKQSILQAKIALSDGPGFPESSPISLGWFT